MLVLPPEVYEKFKNEIQDDRNLSMLDKKMKAILKNKKLNPIQKWYLYRQQLIKYANIRRTRQANQAAYATQSNTQHVQTSPDIDYEDDSVFGDYSDKEDGTDGGNYLFNYNDKSGYVYDQDPPRMTAEEFEKSFQPIDTKRFNQLVFNSPMKNTDNEELINSISEGLQDKVDSLLSQNKRPKVQTTPAKEEKKKSPPPPIKKIVKPEVKQIPSTSGVSKVKPLSAVPRRLRNEDNTKDYNLRKSVRTVSESDKPKLLRIKKQTGKSYGKICWKRFK
jgi:hypothetical protein